MSAGLLIGFFETNTRFDLSYWQGMKAARQFGILILLLVSYLTPAMACMVSNVHMNAEERACCQAMKNQCGQMGVSASHSCCQRTPNAQDNALASRAVTYHPVAVRVIWLSGAERLDLNPVVTGWVEHADYSPPQSPPSSISVLRI